MLRFSILLDLYATLVFRLSGISRIHVHTWHTHCIKHGQWHLKRLVSFNFQDTWLRRNAWCNTIRRAFDRYRIKRITLSNSILLSSHIKYIWQNYTYRCFESVLSIPTVIPRTFTSRQTTLIESSDSCQLEMVLLLRYARHFLS